MIATNLIHVAGAGRKDRVGGGAPDVMAASGANATRQRKIDQDDRDLVVHRRVPPLGAVGWS
jgi:hypothetical protein